MKPAGSSTKKKSTRAKNKTRANAPVVSLTCPGCGARVDDGALGDETTCKYCGAVLRLPLVSDPQEGSATDAAGETAPAAKKELSEKGSSKARANATSTGESAVDTSTSPSPTTLSPPAGAARDPGLEERRAAQAAFGGLALVIVGAIAGGVVFGPAVAVLVLTAGAFVACIAFFWASLRTLLGETPLSGADAYAIGSPRAEEEQKRAVLRALKDLEFERSVGKISEDDYRRLVSHYRNEAKRLLRLLDEEAQPMRERAEALVAARLQTAGLAPKAATVFRQAAKQPGEREREALREEAAEELRVAATDSTEDAQEAADGADDAGSDGADSKKATIEPPDSSDEGGEADGDSETKKSSAGGPS